MTLDGFRIALLPLLLPLLVKTVLFVSVFRWRNQKVSNLTSFLLAGAPLITSIIPIPLPTPVMALAAIGVAFAILSHYTEVKLVPDGAIIIVGAEVVSRLVTAFVL